MQDKNEYNLIERVDGLAEGALFDENMGIRQLVDWASAHTKLCNQYVCEQNEEQKKSFLQRIESSLIYGRHLSESLEGRSRNRKPAIPLSGGRRFGRSTETGAGVATDLLAGNRGGYGISPLKMDFSSATNINATGRQSPCLPSRTYLQKKI
jgi:hypothetical protein